MPMPKRELESVFGIHSKSLYHLKEARSALPPIVSPTRGLGSDTYVWSILTACISREVAPHRIPYASPHPSNISLLMHECGDVVVM